MSAFGESAELGKAPLAPQPQVQQILGRVHITVQDDHVAGPVQGIKNVLVRAQLEPVTGLAFTAVTPLAASPPRGRCTRLHRGLGLLLLLLGCRFLLGRRLLLWERDAAQLLFGQLEPDLKSGEWCSRRIEVTDANESGGRK